MSGFLFSELIFGPVKSRRFGVSLGINLLPTDKKICTFDCVYCECGWTDDPQSVALPTVAQVSEALETRLKKMQESGETPDSITFAGNGEPTLHPEFPAIVRETNRIRDIYFPKAQTTVLSNSTQLHRSEVVAALKMIDNNILKLDAGSEEMIKRINRPFAKFSITRLLKQFADFKGEMTIQTLFLRGEHKGNVIDNTSEAEVRLWLQHLAQIQPKHVMIYPIERETPEESLVKIGHAELDAIAEKVRALGFSVSVYG